MADTNNAVLISQARSAVNATDGVAISDEVIARELEAVKKTVRDEVEEVQHDSTFNLYEEDTRLQMVKSLLKLRVADLRRRLESYGGNTVRLTKVPAEEIPKGVGALRRHDFDDPNLRHWRDKFFRARQSITES